MSNGVSRRSWWWLLPALLALAAQTPARERGERGRVLYAGCLECHGPRAEGVEARQGPRLAGLDDAYLRKQWNKFLDLQRGANGAPPPGEIPPEDRTRFMHPVAQRFTATELDALLAFIGSQKPPAAPRHREGNPERGRRAYVTGCLPCHGAGGEGHRKLEAPRLRGQHGWYLFNQLRDFRMGWRGTDPRDAHGRAMRENTDLGDGDLHDLVAYISGLGR
ncbi:MAG: c-type cytochrome [Verrucomicrobiota bacterium]